MSDLQLGLLAIGALVVAGVLAYNKLQERRAQKSAERAFRSEHPDALLGGDATDEVAEGHSPAPVARVVEAPLRDEGGFAPLQADARLDYLVEAHGESAVPESTILERWSSMVHRFGGRAHLAVGDAAALRSPAGDGPSVTRLQASLQLVSRAGVVGEAELIEFRSDVEDLASRLGWRATAPEMKSALEGARALDAFCADRDIQVALHVVAKSPEGFARESLPALRERFSLEPRADGAWMHADGQGRPLFVVSDRSGGHLDASGPAVPHLVALSLAMDVPRTPDTARSFEAMARLATSLATELGGAIVDDNGTVLDPRALSAIEAQLEAVRVELDARGFAPGEPLALRLFS